MNEKTVPVSPLQAIVELARECGAEPQFDDGGYCPAYIMSPEELLEFARRVTAQAGEQQPHDGWKWIDREGMLHMTEWQPPADCRSAVRLYASPGWQPSPICDVVDAWESQGRTMIPLSDVLTLVKPLREPPAKTGDKP